MIIKELIEIKKQQVALLNREIGLLEKELAEQAEQVQESQKEMRVIDLDKIKRMCRGQGMSVSSLERKLNIARGSIYKWDAHTPSCKKLKDTSEILGVSVDELYMS